MSCFMLFKINKQKENRMKDEENIWVETRAYDKVLYTTDYEKESANKTLKPHSPLI